jgi:hypothetical protein
VPGAGNLTVPAPAADVSDTAGARNVPVGEACAATTSTEGTGSPAVAVSGGALLVTGCPGIDGTGSVTVPGAPVALTTTLGAEPVAVEVPAGAPSVAVGRATWALLMPAGTVVTADGA